MHAAPIARLVVPAGTAAACVVATEPFEDAALEARRFARCAGLAPADQRAHILALVAGGVCLELQRQPFVVRVIADGVRHHAAVVSIGRHGAGAVADDGREVIAAPTTVRASDPAREELLLALQSDARQRPIFHGTTAAGVTYSGFAAADPGALLAAVATSLPQDAPASALAAVFADEPVAIPPGLLIAIAAD